MSEKMTVTEALSEVNLIKKKIEANDNLILGNLLRPTHAKDIYEKDGGSEKFNATVFQSTRDLNTKLIKIRSAISTANLTHSIAIGKEIKTIHDWLIWKREVFQKYHQVVNQAQARAKTQLESYTNSPKVYKDEEDRQQLVQWVSNVDISALQKEAQELSDMYNKLDGQLSLKNATITVEI